MAPAIRAASRSIARCSLTSRSSRACAATCAAYRWCTARSAAVVAVAVAVVVPETEEVGRLMPTLCVKSRERTHTYAEAVLRYAKGPIKLAHAVTQTPKHSMASRTLCAAAYLHYTAHCARLGRQTRPMRTPSTRWQAPRASRPLRDWTRGTPNGRRRHGAKTSLRRSGRRTTRRDRARLRARSRRAPPSPPMRPDAQCPASSRRGAAPPPELSVDVIKRSSASLWRRAPAPPAHRALLPHASRSPFCLARTPRPHAARTPQSP
jgi:hypothetical protein